MPGRARRTAISVEPNAHGRLARPCRGAEKAGRISAGRSTPAALPAAEGVETEYALGRKRRGGGHLVGRKPLDGGDLLADICQVGRLVASAAQRLGRQIRRVGFEHHFVESNGAHSLVEASVAECRNAAYAENEIAARAKRAIEIWVGRICREARGRGRRVSRPSFAPTPSAYV